jgi:enolase
MIPSLIFYDSQGSNPLQQNDLDEKMKELDGTENKGKLGANAILAVSMAICKVTLSQSAHAMLHLLHLYCIFCMYMKIPMRIFKHSYLLYLLVSFLI